MFKSDFPIFTNNPNLVFLDSASSAQKPQQVIDSIADFYSKDYANVHRGIYDLSEQATAMFENAREVIAKFLNAKVSEEIIFTSGTTDGVNFVAYSWGESQIRKDDTILTTQMEHHSNFVPWQQLAIRKQAKFEIVRVNEKFELDLEDLETKLKNLQPRILALTYVSNVLGTINPIEKIVEIKNRISPDTLIFVDAAQATSHIPIDVEKLKVDFLVFSGHKIYGPTGIGVLWMNKKVSENLSPFRFGGGMIENVVIENSTWAQPPEKFEGGTPNIAGAIGLAKAIEYVGKIGFEKIIEHENELFEQSICKLKEINRIKIFVPEQNRTSAISFALEGIHPHDISQILNDDKIAVRAGHHCNQILMKQVLQVAGTTRLSFGIYNEKEDIDRLVEGIGKVIGTFKI